MENKDLDDCTYVAKEFKAIVNIKEEIARLKIVKEDINDTLVLYGINCELRILEKCLASEEAKNRTHLFELGEAFKEGLLAKKEEEEAKKKALDNKRICTGCDIKIEKCPRYNYKGKHLSCCPDCNHTIISYYDFIEIYGEVEA